ncbi:hypothetical protein F7U66_01435 [Vibrio parahaemolyticus]|nr:hypothetical protein [Vibrio parahaemolyticus]
MPRDIFRTRKSRPRWIGAIVKFTLIFSAGFFTAIYSKHPLKDITYINSGTEITDEARRFLNKDFGEKLRKEACAKIYISENSDRNSTVEVREVHHAEHYTFKNEEETKEFISCTLTADVANNFKNIKSRRTETVSFKHALGIQDDHKVGDNSGK